METFFIYLLKTAGVILLFLVFYLVFLRNDTFFENNRFFLLMGLFLSLILPFVTITETVLINPTLVSQGDFEAHTLSFTTSQKSFNWRLLLYYGYTAGALFFFFRFCKQLLSLRQLISSGTQRQKNGINYIETELSSSPFSFFNYIVYNPKQYNETELLAILVHEKIHVRQLHSIDILLTHLLCILQWFNPIMWWYKKCVGQNLEFIADTHSVHETNKSAYQYLLLKVSIANTNLSIVNPFFNSLIKKRIVMLNKSKSSKTSHLKTGLIIPLVGLFLLSFNVKKEFVMLPSNPNSGTAFSEFISINPIIFEITKNTTDDDLRAIKKDLAKKDIDFSYTVVHNSKHEIINISIDFTTKNTTGDTTNNSSFNSNNDTAIDPIQITYNEKTNSISIGDSKQYQIHKDLDHIHEDLDHTVWIHSSDATDHHKTIEIIHDDEGKTITVNGKEISLTELDSISNMEGVTEQYLKIKNSASGEESNIFIMKDNDDFVNIHSASNGMENNFLMIDEHVNDASLILINGKESTHAALKKLKSSEIESMHLYKGKKAIKKYGKKGEDGVLAIKTKKN